MPRISNGDGGPRPVGTAKDRRASRNRWACRSNHLDGHAQGDAKWGAYRRLRPSRWRHILRLRHRHTRGAACGLPASSRTRSTYGVRWSQRVLDRGGRHGDGIALLEVANLAACRGHSDRDRARVVSRSTSRCVEQWDGSQTVSTSNARRTDVFKTCRSDHGEGRMEYQDWGVFSLAPGFRAARHGWTAGGRLTRPCSAGRRGHVQVARLAPSTVGAR